MWQLQKFVLWKTKCYKIFRVLNLKFIIFKKITQDEIPVSSFIQKIYWFNDFIAESSNVFMHFEKST